jgi:hypothetical protein
MPRPIPPAGLCPATPKPFHLPDEDQNKIASILGLPRLPPSMVQLLEEKIAICKTQSDLPNVTVGENIAAIDESLKLGDDLEKSLRRFTDPNSGIGGNTFHALNPSANEALAAINRFRAEANARKKELRDIGTLGIEHGPLGGLCAWIQLAFDAVQRATKDDMRKLHDFAFAVVEAAGIDCEKYREHPGRMKRLFSPAVPYFVHPPLFDAR